jgi:hypothetical protein
MTYIYPYGVPRPHPSLPYDVPPATTTPVVVFSQDSTEELERLRKRVADLEGLVDRLTERVVVLSERP